MGAVLFIVAMAVLSVACFLAFVLGVKRERYGLSILALALVLICGCFALASALILIR